MKVIAANGLRVPHEKRVNAYITDDDVYEVENTAYYRRLLVDGDLIEVVVEEPATKAATKQATKSIKGDE